MILVSACIVLYNTSQIDLQKSLSSLMEEELISKIYLIDNSPKKMKNFIDISNDRIIYIHCPENPGFGFSHNMAINKVLELKYDYHFVVNPDIYFNKGVINEMIDYIEANSSIGMMMPQILNIDGTVQNLPKLIPSIYSIFMRKFRKPKPIYRKFIDKYEFRNYNVNKVYNLPILSGCFSLLNLECISEIGMYDDRYFMYFEDWDLSRRMHKKYKTLFFPKVSVFHGYESGANKNFKLFKIYIRSLIVYFKKWGWIFDKERRKFNGNALKQL